MSKQPEVQLDIVKENVIQDIINSYIGTHSKCGDNDIAKCGDDD